MALHVLYQQGSQVRGVAAMFLVEHTRVAGSRPAIRGKWLHQDEGHGISSGLYDAVIELPTDYKW